MVPHPYLDAIDIACVIWFSCELILRLCTAPNLLKYVRGPFAIIDILSIVPFYVEVFVLLLCVCSGEKSSGVRRGMSGLRILRTLRIFRVLRVLKLARYSNGIQVIVISLRKSLPELAMFGTFVFIFTVLNSTLMYFIEVDENLDFDSIPQAAWWCIVTITTVGYGDIYPTTVLGKILASFTSIAGVIILAFPISIIVERFTETYREFRELKTSKPPHHSRRKTIAALRRRLCTRITSKA